MDLKNLKALIKLMVDNGLTEVDLKDPQGESIRLKRGGDAIQYVAAPQSYAPPQPLAPPQPAAGGAASGAKSSGSDEGLITIGLGLAQLEIDMGYTDLKAGAVKEVQHDHRVEPTADGEEDLLPGFYEPGFLNMV